MIKFLIKSTNTIRVATKEEADELHKQMMNECLENGWILSSWAEKHKERKEKGDVVEEWLAITYAIVFQEEKYPTEILKDIKYDVADFYNEEVEEF